MYLIWFFILTIVKSILVHGELFTSTTHLIKLLNTEIELAKQLETYLKEEYDRLDQVEKYVYDVIYSSIPTVIILKKIDF
jgi:hypothetical protein